MRARGGVGAVRRGRKEEDIARRVAAARAQASRGLIETDPLTAPEVSKTAVSGLKSARAPVCHQMTFCLTELHLWSLKTTLRISDEDIGVHQYYDKKEPGSQMKHGYLEDKQKLAESRDYPWILKNKRPEKLRDTLKEVEDLMQNSQCVLSKWKNKRICQEKLYERCLIL